MYVPKRWGWKSHVYLWQGLYHDWELQVITRDSLCRFCNVALLLDNDVHVSASSFLVCCLQFFFLKRSWLLFLCVPLDFYKSHRLSLMRPFSFFVVQLCPLDQVQVCWEVPFQAIDDRRLIACQLKVSMCFALQKVYDQVVKGWKSYRSEEMVFRFMQRPNRFSAKNRIWRIRGISKFKVRTDREYFYYKIKIVFDRRLSGNSLFMFLPIKREWTNLCKFSGNCEQIMRLFEVILFQIQGMLQSTVHNRKLLTK